MAANREHKNSVFSLLFSDTEVLRELYGALEGIQLGPEVPIVINTLSDVLFKDQLNDLSFLVDTKLIFLFEHQSSINPNMPLRLLMYMSKIKEFLETNASEVLNMLITEWSTEEWGQVCREEGRGIEKLETARNAFAKGLPIDLIRDITGLDTETLNRLSAK
jgi:hypothetical protein